MTTLLFGSDYAELKAQDVIASLGNDPRLIRVSQSDIFSTSIPKLAAKYGLVASNCECSHDKKTSLLMGIHSTKSRFQNARSVARFISQ